MQSISRQRPIFSVNALNNMERSKAALVDIGYATQFYVLWMTLAWNDIRQRYRRSALGPFWLTLSTLLTIAIIGPLYGHLFGQNIREYYPYLSIGLISWSFLSLIVVESGQAFIGSEAYIKELPLPLTLYVYRVVWRNLLILLHNFLIIIPLLCFFGAGFHFFTFMWVPGLLAAAVNGMLIGIVIATLCARFRDVPQIIQNFIQVMFFATPVMWRASSLGRYQTLGQLNPFQSFIDVIRAPILGEALLPHSWEIVCFLTVLNFLLAFLCLSRLRHRVAFWL